MYVWSYLEDALKTSRTSRLVLIGKMYPRSNQGFEHLKVSRVPLGLRGFMVEIGFSDGSQHRSYNGKFEGSMLTCQIAACPRSSPRSRNTSRVEVVPNCIALLFSLPKSNSSWEHGFTSRRDRGARWHRFGSIILRWGHCRPCLPYIIWFELAQGIYLVIFTQCLQVVLKKRIRSWLMVYVLSTMLASFILITMVGPVFVFIQMRGSVNSRLGYL